MRGLGVRLPPLALVSRESYRVCGFLAFVAAGILFRGFLSSLPGLLFGDFWSLVAPLE